MKRCALIISDDLDFRERFGCHVKKQWPKMAIEYSRVASGPAYLDRTEISRYRLIIVRLGFKSSADLRLCIYLLRILNLPIHPDVVIIGDSDKAVRYARPTALGAAACLSAIEASPSTIDALLAAIARQQDGRIRAAVDGAPDIHAYRIREPIAATSTATIYRAFSEERGEDVALKVCDRARPNKSQRHRLALRQEYETLLTLGGDYVANAYDYGEVGPIAYMAQEYFPRGGIGSLFASAGRNASRVAYLQRVAEALRHIHDAGYLHLDLKPENVMIRADNTPVLIDFGNSMDLAAARRDRGGGCATSSPHFMSPEQSRGEPLDERSDLYSFGALWFRVFTGQVPFPGRSLDEVGAAQDHARAPSMGEALTPYQPIVDKTLAGSPGLRFRTAQELIGNIDYYFGTATGMRRMPYFVERRRRRSGGEQELIHNIDFYFGAVPGKHWLPTIAQRRKHDSGRAIRLHDRQPRWSDGDERTRSRALA
jgi:serine/threonine protein kinase